MATITLSIPAGRIGHFLAGTTVASVIGGTAVAVTSQNFTYSTLQYGYLSIDAAAMVPSNEETSANYRIFPGFYLESSVDPQGCFATGINLPQGSKLRSVTTFFRSSAQSDLKVVLYRSNMESSNTVELVDEQYFENSGNGVSVETPVPVRVGVIDNQKFSYGYSICLSGGTAFENARFFYTYKTAGD